MSKELKKKELIFKKQIDFNVATVNCFQTYISTIGFFIDNGIVIRTEDSLETRTDPAVYLVYVENCLILEPSTLLGATNVNKY